MQEARLSSIEVKVDGQTVDIKRSDLKIVCGGFVYLSSDGDLFIPISGLTPPAPDADGETENTGEHYANSTKSTRS